MLLRLGGGLLLVVYDEAKAALTSPQAAAYL